MDEARNPRKRKLPAENPQRAIASREREKRKRQQEEDSRREETNAQRSPYHDLAVEELKKLIYEKTGEKTRKRNRLALVDILWNADHGDRNDSTGKSQSLSDEHFVFLPYNKSFVLSSKLG